MNPLNIAEWTPDKVAEWMSGLGPTIAQYAPDLLNKGVNGTKLLTLRCDDLEYLGIHVIGHQELLLEAVEHLRNFHYEISRECVQQLALRVSAAAASLARALRHHADTRLETHSLADVARTLHAVKALVCWLDRWPLCSGAPLAERKAALLKLSLEAATCAQRDRFAEQPARAVAAAAAAAAAVADYIIQDVSDPMILQPAWVDAVTLRQRGALGFQLLPASCGHLQLAHIRFGSPAHASGHVHEGDEILQVGEACVIGWSGAAVERACAAAGGELLLRLRRRGARALPAPPARRARRPPAPAPHLRPALRYELEFPRTPVLPPAAAAPPGERAGRAGSPPPHSPAPSSSDESEPVSPPASPTQLHLDRARLCPPKPRAAAQRRHSVSGGSPVARRPHLGIEQFWQELQQQRWELGGPERDDSSLYRIKAVSCSTGLQLSPRPRTCLGVPRAPIQPPSAEPPQATCRGKLDKSHSTPAYELEPAAALAPLSDNPIPESPTTPTMHKMDKQSDPLKDIQTETIDTSHDKTDKVSQDEAEDVSRDVSRGKSEDKPQGASDISQEDIKLIDDVSSDDADAPAPVLETLNTVLTGAEVVVTRVEDELQESTDRVSVKYPKPRITQRWKVPDEPPEPPPRPNTRQPPPPPREHLPPPPPPSQPARDREPVVPPRDPKLRDNSSLPRRDDKNRELARLDSKSIRDTDENSNSNREPLGSLSDLKILSPCREIHHVFERDLEWSRSPIRDVREGQSWEPISGQPASPLRESPAPQYPVLRMIPRPAEPRDSSPLKPLRPGDPAQISVPLRHITKHDIKLLSTERRELPALNGEPARRDGDIVLGAASEPDARAAGRGMFPSSKARSLKKKNSILAKRREVPARALAARGAGGWVWQRVRARHQQQPRWAQRHLLLTHNLLYAYRSPESLRADCMIYLAGCTVSAAGEVKSRAHAFKVYHTGSAFYFAAASRDALLAWTQLIQRATLLPSVLAHNTDIKQFSETDYSETESETESPEKRDRDKEKEKDKDKSKFGSLKKLTHRGTRSERSESHENVNQATASTSLDRKYLRFFSRARAKDDSKSTKSKQSAVPVPTEHYRSYRRALPAPPPPAGSPPPAPPAPRGKPSPINYIHASNPNLLDFEKSDFVTKPAIQPKPKVKEKLVGFVTLEEFMLKKQEEERKQLYSERVLLGVTDRKQLQRRLDRIVPDVIYGEVDGAREAGDGYEQIGFPEERADSNRSESFRRKDKVHLPASNSPQTQPANESSSSGSSGSSVSRLRLMFGGRQGAAGGAGAATAGAAGADGRPGQYPHLQCPPTFQPESYSLARLAPRQP